MKGTKLWIEAGSPLIRGASRNARSFRREWFMGVLAAAAVVAAVIAYTSKPLTAADAVLALPVLVGASLASWPAIWLAQRMGSRRAWIAGAVAGVLGASAAMWVSTQFGLLG